MDSLKSNPAIDQAKLFSEKGKCIFCGSTKHSAKDCQVNLNTTFEKDPARAKNSQAARDLAAKFFAIKK